MPIYSNISITNKQLLLLHIKTVQMPIYSNIGITNKQTLL